VSEMYKISVFEIYFMRENIIKTPDVYIDSGFNYLNSQYIRRLKNLDQYFNDETSSEFLTGNVKLFMLNTMQEMKDLDVEIDQSIVELKAAKEMIRHNMLEYKNNGLGRIERILQYRRIYNGEQKINKNKFD
jgi:hypothetical protein